MNLPLKLMFKPMLYDWKKSNVVPFHKNRTKTLIKSYQPISTLPVLRKFLKN